MVTGVASVRHYQKFLLCNCFNQAHASWLRVGLATVKAETITDGGRTSEIKYLKSGGSYCAGLQPEKKGVAIRKGKPWSVKQDRKEMLHVPELRFCQLQPLVQIVVRQLCPAARGGEIHL